MASDHASENGVDGDDEREEDDDEEEVEEEAVEEEEEPRLKYQRMGGSLSSLLSTDAAASIAIAERMIALGTHDGTVHILDFQGNQVKEFSSHSATVNDICFDAEGEYVSSCSDDGSVVINSLFTDERMKFEYHRPMKSIALDPDYSRKSTRRFVAGGLAGQLFLNSKTWLGYNKQVLHDGEGPIHAVKWRTCLIAWANDAGVKVYDMVNNVRVTFIERPRGSPRPELLLPHLVWQDDTLLVIGWGTSVKVAAIRTNSLGVNGIQKSIPTSSAKYVDIVASFQTTYYISGIAPFGDALVVLAYIPEKVNGEKDFSSTMPSRQGTAQRPEVRIVTWKNEELTTDALPVHGFEHYKAKDYALAHAPFTGSSYAGGQWAAGDEPLYYIVSPKDVVIARPRDAEDHIAWLLQHGFHEKALAAVEAGQGRNELLDEVVQLMMLDSKKAVPLLIHHRDNIPPSEVVEQLLSAHKNCNAKYFLHLYLHSLFEVDVNAGKEYHDLQVELYADYEPRMLLTFLRLSQHYKLDKAYDVCVRKGLLREQVFILGRMGNAKRALAVMIDKLEDIEEAVEFVSMQQDDELWQELIKQCLRKPEMVGMLLEHTVGNLDPLYIVTMVPDGLKVPRLRDRLVKIITDYRTETSLRKGCNEILKTDCVNLLIKYYKEAQRAVCMGSTEEEKHSKAAESSSTLESQRGSSNAGSIELKSRIRGSGRCCLCFDPFSIQNVSVVVFFCCHAYHATCLAGSSDSFNMGTYVTNSDDKDDDDEDAPAGGSQVRCVLCTTAAG
ncbi:vacuolar protein sorting-associated protein 41 homolog isoform X3 [Dendrobium catenatum]|uniref:vacuolar protein sorting-associated protein 41 homolog isoform X3 n=1 Tax=Dendrobium catenatum TaxID=906689 RepID=UPI0010A0B876|nr:vacuolar protein sorting-associated protein 41 homolog isoform X3 [Dendrobium catenatum]